MSVILKFIRNLQYKHFFILARFSYNVYARYQQRRSRYRRVQDLICEQPVLAVEGEALDDAAGQVLEGLCSEAGLEGLVAAIKSIEETKSDN